MSGIEVPVTDRRPRPVRDRLRRQGASRRSCPPTRSATTPRSSGSLPSGSSTGRGPGRFRPARSACGLPPTSRARCPGSTRSRIASPRGSSAEGAGGDDADRQLRRPQRLVVSVSLEATRQGSYLVVKDRWRSPLHRDGATGRVRARPARQRAHLGGARRPDARGPAQAVGRGAPMREGRAAGGRRRSGRAAGRPACSSASCMCRRPGARGRVRWTRPPKGC